MKKKVSLEKLLKLQANEIEKRVKRHIGVLIEDSDTKVEAIAEQYGSLVEKIDKNTSDIEEIKDTLLDLKIQSRVR